MWYASDINIIYDIIIIYNITHNMKCNACVPVVFVMVFLVHLHAYIHIHIMCLLHPPPPQRKGPRPLPFFSGWMCPMLTRGELPTLQLFWQSLPQSWNLGVDSQPKHSFQNFACQPSLDPWLTAPCDIASWANMHAKSVGGDPLPSVCILHRLLSSQAACNG